LSGKANLILFTKLQFIYNQNPPMVKNSILPHGMLQLPYQPTRLAVSATG